MKEFLMGMLNNQDVLQIIFTVTILYIVYVVGFILWHGGLYKAVPMDASEHIFFDPDPLMRPILIITLFSWLIYEKPFINQWFLWSMDYTLIKWILIILFVATIGIWIFQIGILIYFLISGIIYTIKDRNNNKRRKRVELTKEEQEVFEFCVDKFQIYKEKYMSNDSSLVVEAKEVLYKSVLALHILNPKDVKEYYDMRSYEWVLSYYPDGHPVKKYYAEFEEFPLFVQECMAGEVYPFDKMLENMNQFVRSNIREYKSSK